MTTTFHAWGGKHRGWVQPDPAGDGGVGPQRLVAAPFASPGHDIRKLADRSLAAFAEGACDVKSSRPLVILTPVFEDRASAAKLFGDLVRHCPIKPYIVAVEDGSMVDPLQIGDLLQSGVDGEIIYLSRNLGHQRAIATGLCHIAATIAAESVVVMDADGEDRPDTVCKLLEALNAPGTHAVVARRGNRSESWRFRYFYFFYRLLFVLLTGRELQYGNFCALSNPALRRMVKLQEAWLHFPASLMVSRLKVQSVTIDRGVRYFGNSKMNFVSLALHGMRSIMVFAEDVLVRVGTVSVLVAVVSVVLIGITFALKIIGFSTPGWFSTVSGILIIIVLQAGILTFVTLMVSGLVKSGAPIAQVDLGLLIDKIESTSRHAAELTALPMH